MRRGTTFNLRSNEYLYKANTNIESLIEPKNEEIDRDLITAGVKVTIAKTWKAKPIDSSEVGVGTGATVVIAIAGSFMFCLLLIMAFYCLVIRKKVTKDTSDPFTEVVQTERDL